MAKAQLEQAKPTTAETEKLSAESKERLVRIESLSDETREDVKEQITKLIDKQDENFKTVLQTPERNNQNELLMSILPQIFASPENLKNIIEFANNSNK